MQAGQTEDRRFTGQKTANGNAVILIVIVKNPKARKAIGIIGSNWNW
jgi:hypothetical protein